MTSMQLRSVVESLKRKAGRGRPSTIVRPSSTKHKAACSPYEDGVKMAKEAVKQYRKDLDKIK